MKSVGVIAIVLFFILQIYVTKLLQYVLQNTSEGQQAMGTVGCLA